MSRLPQRAAPAASRFSDAVEVGVEVVPGLVVQVLEASVDWQEALIEKACDAEEGSIETDPFGVALWPAAQVLAQAAAAHAAAHAAAAEGTEGGARPLRTLELGAGCGLASLALAASGADALATDFRSLPLELLEESAGRQGLKVLCYMICYDSILYHIIRYMLYYTSYYIYYSICVIILHQGPDAAARRPRALRAAAGGGPGHRLRRAV